MHVGKFARGLGWFYPAEYIPSAELPDEEYPIILMTGRILYHYTTRAMTGKTPELMEIEGSSFIEMNEEDAAELGIKNGDRVRLTSRRGQIESILLGITGVDDVTDVQINNKCANYTLESDEVPIGGVYSG